MHAGSSAGLEDERLLLETYVRAVTGGLSNAVYRYRLYGLDYALKLYQADGRRRRSGAAPPAPC